MEKDFKFINQKDIYQYKFYMIPKELFINERYISLSPAAIQEQIDKLKITFKRYVILKMILLVRLLLNLEIWIFGKIKIMNIDIK